VKLKKLFKDIKNIEIKGSKDIEISGIAIDSRAVFPNSLFIAKKGNKFDGSKFIYDAKNAGASAILTDIFDPFLNIAQIIHKNPAEIEADISARYYENPSKDLFSIAITGTSGKTTTSYLIKHVFDDNEKSLGVIGSLGHFTGKKLILSDLGTPQSADLQKYLKEMVVNKLDSFCMEATSIGIDQNRIKNIDFDVAIFTNLTHEHLDYHKTFSIYKEAKKKLFSNLSNKSFAILNIDDENSLDMVEKSVSKIITYSCKKQADFEAKGICFSIEGSYFTLVHNKKSYLVSAKLIGKFNVYNILAAVACATLKRIPIENIIKSINSFDSISGRLEKINIKKPFHVFIDYAHKEDALKNVLETLREVKKSNIITVFGCGGQRDTFKRPKMAKVAQDLSDITIVTSDNPRTEDPLKIIDEIKVGFSNNYNYFSEPDRYKAIEMALNIAKEDDIVLIAGKGHETYQILKDKTIEFDDKKVCIEIAKKL